MSLAIVSNINMLIKVMADTKMPADTKIKTGRDNCMNRNRLFLNIYIFTDRENCMNRNRLFLNIYILKISEHESYPRTR